MISLMNLTIYIYIYFLNVFGDFCLSLLMVMLQWFSICLVYYIGCVLIAKCRLQSHIYIYVIVIFYYLHKTYIQEQVFCLHYKSSHCSFLLSFATPPGGKNEKGTRRTNQMHYETTAI